MKGSNTCLLPHMCLDKVNDFKGKPVLQNSKFLNKWGSIKHN